MDVESQKMSEPEITSQTDTNNNQVCGHCVACFNALLHQIPDVCRTGVTVRGVFVTMAGVVLGQQDTEVFCTCLYSWMHEHRKTGAMQRYVHKRSLEFSRLKGFLNLKRSG